MPLRVEDHLDRTTCPVRVPIAPLVFRGPDPHVLARSCCSEDAGNKTRDFMTSTVPPKQHSQPGSPTHSNNRVFQFSTSHEEMSGIKISSKVNIKIQKTNFLNMCSQSTRYSWFFLRNVLRNTLRSWNLPALLLVHSLTTAPPRENADSRGTQAVWEENVTRMHPRWGWSRRENGNGWGWSRTLAPARLIAD